MSEMTKNNDVLSNFLGGIFTGKSNILVILLIVLLFSQGGFWGKFDENLILVFIVIILLFSGSFKFY